MAPLSQLWRARSWPDVRSDARQPDRRGEFRLPGRGALARRWSRRNRRLAIYVDARKGGRTAASPGCGAGSMKPPAPRSNSRFFDALDSHARLMCLGLEGVSADRCRAKVYWRLDQVRRLDNLGIPPWRIRASSAFSSRRERLRDPARWRCPQCRLPCRNRAADRHQDRSLLSPQLPALGARRGCHAYRRSRQLARAGAASCRSARLRGTRQHRCRARLPARNPHERLSEAIRDRSAEEP